MRLADISLDESGFAAAVKLLAESDGDLGGVVQRHGSPAFHRSPANFETLGRLIIEQQVSLSSAAATHARIESHLNGFGPEQMLRLDLDVARSLGLSRQKHAYLQGLSKAVLSGLDLGGLIHSPEEDARNTLMSLKGVGSWTAEVFLMEALGHPDIWPVGDRALIVAVQHLKGDTPVEEVGALHSPFRSVAARIYWHDYLCRRNRPPARTSVVK